MDLLGYLVSTRTATDLGVLVLIKGTLLLGVAAMASRGLRGNGAAFRHRVWETALLALLLLPAFQQLLPAWTASKAVVYPAETPWVGIEAIETDLVSPTRDAAADLAHPVGEAIPLATFALLVWWAGVVVVATGLLGNLVRAERLRRRATPIPADHSAVRMLETERRAMGIRRPVAMRLGEDSRLAATLGVLRPQILVGAEVLALPPAELRALLIHELAHIQRHDWLLYLLSNVALPLYWPNPLVWWARRQAAAERERACDDAVLRRGVDSPLYARILVDFAAHPLATKVHLPTAFLATSPTVARIHAILDGAPNRRPLGVALGAMVGMALVLVTIPAASLRVVTTVPGTGPAAQLVGALVHPNPDVRARAARTLGRREVRSARAALEGLLDDTASSVRLAAMYSLETLADPASLPAIARVLDRPFGVPGGEHGLVLKHAMFAAGRIGSPVAISVLETQLTRPTAPLRMLALSTILTMPGGRAVARSHLERVAASDPSERNRRLARDALATY